MDGVLWHFGVILEENYFIYHVNGKILEGLNGRFQELIKDSKTKIISQMKSCRRFSIIYLSIALKSLKFLVSEATIDNLLYIKLNVEERYTYTISRSSLH